jgi:hypothetical protein
MFEDMNYCDRLFVQQYQRFRQWFRKCLRADNSNNHHDKIVFLEIGVGRTILNLKRLCDRMFNFVSTKADRVYLYVNVGPEDDDDGCRRKRKKKNSNPKPWKHHVPLKASELSVLSLTKYL